MTSWDDTHTDFDRAKCAASASACWVAWSIEAMDGIGDAWRSLSEEQQQKLMERWQRAIEAEIKCFFKRRLNWPADQPADVAP